MSKLVKHSRVSKQPRETMMISNSIQVDKKMKGEPTTWNVSNSDTFASNNQGIGLLRNKFLNLNGDDNATFIFPSLSFKGLVLATQFASFLAQNDHVIRPMASGLSIKNLFMKDLKHGSNALGDSATFGGFVLHPQHGKVEKATQLLSNGGRSNGDVLRPPTPQALPPTTAQDMVEMAMLKNRIPNVEVPLQLHQYEK